MGFNLTVTHLIILKLFKLTVNQNVKNYVIVFSGNFHRLLITFIKISFDTFNNKGFLANFEAPLLSWTINFFKSFFEFIQWEDFWMGVGDTHRILRIDWNVDLCFVFMRKRFFPKINKFWGNFSFFSKCIVISCLRLSKNNISKLKIFLFMSR